MTVRSKSHISVMTHVAKNLVVAVVLVAYKSLALKEDNKEHQVQSINIEVIENPAKPWPII